MPVSSNITMRVESATLKRIDQATRMSVKNCTQFMINAAPGGGDTLVVCRLADPGRSVAHIIDVLQGLTARGIPFCLEPPLAVDTLHTPAA